MRTSVVVACVALLAQPALAQWSGWDYENDRPAEEFKELATALPAYPRDSDLLPFDAGPASGHRFYVDSKSLSVGKDGVVRYTLVMKTAGGATNVSYEGIRCDLRQVKIFASGRSDGTWAPAREPRWTRIETRPVDIHHGVLFRDYFCFGKSSKTPLARVEEALELFRNGGPKSVGE